MSDTATRTRDILAETLGAKREDVTDDKAMIELGADSLDELDAVLRLENEFSIEITDDEADAIVTVGDLVRLVEGRAG